MAPTRNDSLATPESVTLSPPGGLASCKSAITNGENNKRSPSVQIDRPKALVMKRRTHNRSRKGCMVCRNRHKRCDENFVDGSCDRCRTSGFQCVLRSDERYTKYSRLIASGGSSSNSNQPASSVLPLQTVNHQPLDADTTLSSAELSDFISTLFQPLDPSTNLLADNSVSMVDIPTWPATNDSSCITIAPSSPTHSSQDRIQSRPSTNDGGSSGEFEDQVFLSGALGEDTDVYSACLLGQQRYAAAVTRDSAPHRATRGKSPESPVLTDSDVGDVTKRYQSYQDTWLPKQPIQSLRASSTIGLGGPRATHLLSVSTRSAVLEGLRIRASAHDQNMGPICCSIALQLLGDPGQFSLSDALASVCDLQVYNFTVAGCAASYGPLAIGEAIIRGASGGQLLLVDLEEAGRNQPGLAAFAQADICHCLCTGDRSPILLLAPIKETSSASANDHLIIPLRVHHILNDICILTMPNAENLPGISKHLWDAVQAASEDTNVPTIWSSAAAIVYQQRFHKAGPLHPIVRAMSWDILLALPPVTCRKIECFPLFIAGTNAILETQRTATRQRWVEAPEKGFEEAMTFLENYWAHMDKTGHTVYWLDYMRESNVVLAFF